MLMTHYMELLATNQPWNLILFMAVPIILAETVAVTELYLLFTRATSGVIKQLNRTASILVGLYFIGIIAYLVPNAVIPITANGEWRTAIDVVAVGAYLLGGLPLILMMLQEVRIIDRSVSAETRLARHAAYVGVFLVFAHIAMIAGMLDPSLLGWSPAASPMEGMDMMGGNEPLPTPMTEGGMAGHAH